MGTLRRSSRNRLAARRRMESGGDGSFRALSRAGDAAHDCVSLAYFKAEKSVGSMNVESTFSTIFPSASEALATFCHSGSPANSFQFLVAASWLGCETM